MSNDTLSRRLLLTRTTTGLWAALITPAFSRTLTAQQTPSVPSRPDPLPAVLVNEFVRKAHGDLAATRALLAETPSLLNATWDWGGGDFETGLGGAGHMGNREIAEFLIGQGARMDIFVAAMLGRLDVVKTMIDAYPPLLHAKGPHGITLMAHARKGSQQAVAVVEYLTSKGLTS